MDIFMYRYVTHPYMHNTIGYTCITVLKDVARHKIVDAVFALSNV